MIKKTTLVLLTSLILGSCLGNRKTEYIPEVIIEVDTTKYTSNVFYDDLRYKYTTNKGSVFYSKTSKHSIGDKIKTIRISYDEK